MKIIKRGQLAMLSISFMVMIAGYINYKYDPTREKNLGQTTKVSSDEVYLYATNKDVDVYKETMTTTNRNETVYETKKSENLATFKSTRDNMFSELEETYRAAIDSVAVTSTEVKTYQEKLDEVVKKKHLINIVEGILKTKGIENIVIVPTEDKYNVVVKLNEKLTEAQAAMIEKIIQEEFNTSPDKVNIIQQ